MVMKNVFTSLFVMLSMIVFAQNKQTTPVKSKLIEPFYINIDLTKAKDIIANKKEVVLLDVRTPEEIAQGKIANAVELDIKDPAFKEKLNQMDKTKQYMVYCYAGGRSATAMKMMRDLGFKQVYNFDGGYKAWSSNQ